MGLESIIIRMVSIIQGIGLITKKKGKEFIFAQITQDIKDNTKIT